MIENLNLQISSYFYHQDYRRCEYVCYYDEDSPTKFNIDLGKLSAQSIYTTRDLENDNIIYLKMYF